MKSVCHLTTVHNCTDNRIFYKECFSVAEAGYKTTLIAPGTPTYKGDDISIVTIGRPESRILRMIFSSFFGALQKAISVKADLYHLHDPELIFTGLVLKLMGKKVVYDAHENVGAALLSKSYLKGNLVKKLVSNTISGAIHGGTSFFDGIVTARPDIAKTFSHKNICTLCNFPKLSDIDSPHANDPIEKSKLSVIFVGDMTTIRGIGELVDAVASLDDVELWLLGRFTDKALFERCQKSEGWKNVRFFGKVEPYQVFDYIEQADIGIVTFWPEPNHLTTLATKPFEYMSKGLPMIMSDMPFWKEFFKDSALYVDPKDSGAISTVIEKLASDGSLREEMGRKNRELIYEKYNWEKEKGKLIELYQTIFQADNTVNAIKCDSK